MPTAKSYRVGNHYGIHVYEGERPVATFHDADEARIFVFATGTAEAIRTAERERALAVVALFKKRAMETATEMSSEQQANLCLWCDRIAADIRGDALSAPVQAGVPQAGKLDLHEYVLNYTFEHSDGGSYTPTEPEQAMIEDAICGYLAEAAALAGKDAEPEGGAGEQQG